MILRCEFIYDIVNSWIEPLGNAKSIYFNLLGIIVSSVFTILIVTYQINKNIKMNNDQLTRQKVQNSIQ